MTVFTSSNIYAVNNMVNGCAMSWKYVVSFGMKLNSSGLLLRSIQLINAIIIFTISDFAVLLNTLNMCV